MSIRAFREHVVNVHKISHWKYTINVQRLYVENPEFRAADMRIHRRWHAQNRFDSRTHTHPGMGK